MHSFLNANEISSFYALLFTYLTLLGQGLKMASSKPKRLDTFFLIVKVQIKFTLEEATKAQKGNIL